MRPKCPATLPAELLNLWVLRLRGPLVIDLRPERPIALLRRFLLTMKTILVHGVIWRETNKNNVDESPTRPHPIPESWLRHGYTIPIDYVGLVRNRPNENWTALFTFIFQIYDLKISPTQIMRKFSLSSTSEHWLFSIRCVLGIFYDIR